MPLPNASQIKSVSDISRDADALRELADAHTDWFISIDGRAPLNVNKHDFEFSAAHARLIFSCWTETGSTTWHVKGWNWNGEKLVLQTSRRMGAEVATVELIPHASAKAVVASIAAARQERCDRLAQLVAQTLVGGSDKEEHRLKSVPPSLKIERAALSPGMRRDQPGRYARIILRLPHERVAVTGTVAQTDIRNVDALFSSALLWFQRALESSKRPPIHRLLLVIERQILAPPRQRHG